MIGVMKCSNLKSKRAPKNPLPEAVGGGGVGWPNGSLGGGVSCSLMDSAFLEPPGSAGGIRTTPGSFFRRGGAPSGPALAVQLGAVGSSIDLDGVPLRGDVPPAQGGVVGLD